MAVSVDLLIAGAKDLKDVARIGKPSPYVVVDCDGKRIGKSKERKKTLSPAFDYKLGFPVKSDASVIDVVVKSNGKDMGGCKLNLAKIVEVAGYDQVKQLKLPLVLKGKEEGMIVLSIRVKSEAGSPVRPRASSESPQSPQSPDGKVISPEIRKRASRIYKKYAPEKLAGLEHILSSNKRTDDELIAALVKRYGPEPDVSSSSSASSSSSSSAPSSPSVAPSEEPEDGNEDEEEAMPSPSSSPLPSVEKVQEEPDAVEPEEEPETENELRQNTEPMEGTDATIAKQKEQIVQLMVKVKDLKAENDALIETVDNEEHTKKRLSSKIETLESTLEAHELKKAEQEANAEKETQPPADGDREESLRIREQEVDQREDAVTQQEEVLEARDEKLREREQAIMSKTSNTDTVLSEVEDNISRLNGQQLMKEEELEKVAKMLQEAKTELQETEDIISQRVQEHDTREASLNTRETHLKQLEASTDGADGSKVQELEQVLARKEQELEAARAKLEYKERLADQELEKAANREEELQRTIKQLQGEVSTKTVSHSSNEEGLNSRMDKVREEERRITATREQVNNQTKRLYEEVQKKSEDAAAKLKKANDFSKELQAKETELATREQEINEREAGVSCQLEELKIKMLEAEKQKLQGDRGTTPPDSLLMKERDTAVEKCLQLEIDLNLLRKDKLAMEERKLDTDRAEAAAAERLRLIQTRTADLNAKEEELKVKEARLGQMGDASHDQRVSELETQLKKREAELDSMTPHKLAEEALRLATLERELQEKEKNLQSPAHLSEWEKGLQQREEALGACSPPSFDAEKEREKEEGLEKERVLLRDKEQLLSQREVSVVEKELIIKEREDNLDSSSREIDRRWAQLTEHEYHFFESSQKDDLVDMTMLQKELSEHEEQLTAREMELDQRELQNKAREAGIRKQAKGIEEKEAAFKANEQGWTRTLQNLEAREQSLKHKQEREEELKARSEEMKELLTQVRLKARSLEDQQSRLDERESIQMDLQSRLTKKEMKLKEIEERNMTRPARESALAAREQAHDRREETLRRREKEMQAALVAKERELLKLVCSHHNHTRSGIAAQDAPGST
eukprot:TRINITY_DN14791_c0_g1_i1.p1 TRINITY_DN14791_c0_g1~~TRINITY_DN14791_c0_g1_i1.p1  ORF type:complete len:1094 (+),score=346.60 TRINITY_DN14791_c0_g1_i1:42-3323(+)